MYVCTFISKLIYVCMYACIYVCMYEYKKYKCTVQEIKYITILSLRYFSCIYIFIHTYTKDLGHAYIHIYTHMHK